MIIPLVKELSQRIQGHAQRYVYTYTHDKRLDKKQKYPSEKSFVLEVFFLEIKSVSSPVSIV